MALFWTEYVIHTILIKNDSLSWDAGQLLWR